MDKAPCCCRCVHCDFDEYWDEYLDDEVSGWFCELGHDDDFEYDEGVCDDYE